MVSRPVVERDENFSKKTETYPRHIFHDLSVSLEILALTLCAVD